MKVILKKDVQSLGESGDIVDVKDGHARNYLLPYKFAELATDGALKNRERNLARIKAQAEKLHAEAVAKADTIKAIGKLQITTKAGESGKLFGAITTRKLAEEVIAISGVEVDRRNISLNKPINIIGEYKMAIKLTSKVTVELPVVVSASEVFKEEVEEVSAVEETVTTEE
ncbi:MAG: 50S ribosomal protein L9 [Candidatus Melainabacteria bacterium GWA2_34_9]|nr:MAG: 50S ribosomal protein L9 [Candidatus Melainabacteria bacterium GWA2_34_9]